MSVVDLKKNVYANTVFALWYKLVSVTKAETELVLCSHTWFQWEWKSLLWTTFLYSNLYLFVLFLSHLCIIKQDLTSLPKPDNLNKLFITIVELQIKPICTAFQPFQQENQKVHKMRMPNTNRTSSKSDCSIILRWWFSHWSQYESNIYTCSLCMVYLCKRFHRQRTNPLRNMGLRTAFHVDF